jgi:two-component system sensor histidine kinase KdpD
VEAAVNTWKSVENPARLRVRFEPARDLPAVAASPPDLQRLIRLLLANAAAAPGVSTLAVRTEAARPGARLVVEDNGPAIPTDLMEHVFEPFVVARPAPGVSELNPTSELGLALCKRLARRQQANIHAENRPEGGVRVVVQLRPAEQD